MRVQCLEIIPFRVPKLRFEPASFLFLACFSKVASHDSRQKKYDIFVLKFRKVGQKIILSSECSDIEKFFLSSSWRVWRVDGMECLREKQAKNRNETSAT